MEARQDSINPRDGRFLSRIVQQWARDLGFSSEATADIVQSVWLELVKRGLDPATPRARGYAQVVVRNTRTQLIRERDRTSRARERVRNQEGSSSSDYDQVELSRACQQVLDVEERWAMIRLFVHGSTYHDLAEETNRSVGWWHKRVKRAKERIIAQFDLPESGARPGWRAHDEF